MANPQPEPFLKFSKELFDALLLSPMPATHKEIVLAVIRRTDGDYEKHEAPISLSLLQRMTGRAASGVRRCLTSLIEEGVIVQVTPPTFRKPAVLRLNKDYEGWGRWSVESATVVADRHELREGEQGDSQSATTVAVGSATLVAQESAITVAPWKNTETVREKTPPEGTAAPPVPPFTAQTVVQHAVDHARGSGRTLDSAYLGHLGRKAKELIESGAGPPQLLAAAERLVDDNASPKDLGYKLRDVEGGSNGRSGTHRETSGRSQNGEW